MLGEVLLLLDHRGPVRYRDDPGQTDFDGIGGVRCAGGEKAEGAHAGALAHEYAAYREVLDGGVERLKAIGFTPTSKLVVGQPAEEIGAYAQEIKADLVVVSHRRQSFLQRWWSGPSGAYLSDQIGCSLLIARAVISPEEFRAEMEQIMPAAT